MGKRRRWGHNDPELPNFVPLKGPPLGAIVLGQDYHEEGLIRDGSSSERWRLTDDVNAMLAPTDEFVMGSTIMEVVAALEAMFPSPVGGVSMIEIVDEHDVKRHSMPFADSVLWDTKPNPHYTPHSRYYG